MSGRLAGRMAAATIIALWLVIVATPAQAVEVRVSDLLDRSAELAGSEVQLVGELVGDYGTRGTGWMWTQLNDDTYARSPLVDGGPKTGSNIGVGVRIPIGQTDQLDPPGGYRLRGPLVRVTGVWMHHDPARQGESYLEVNELVVIDGGKRIEEGADTPVALAGVALLLISAVLWLRRPARDA